MVTKRSKAAAPPKRESSYRILLRPEPEGGYTVIVPSLPGCVTYGETLTEARSMASDAIAVRARSRSSANVSRSAGPVALKTPPGPSSASRTSHAARSDSNVAIHGAAPKSVQTGDPATGVSSD